MRARTGGVTLVAVAAAMVMSSAADAAEPEPIACIQHPVDGDYLCLTLPDLPDDPAPPI